MTDTTPSTPDTASDSANTADTVSDSPDTASAASTGGTGTNGSDTLPVGTISDFNAAPNGRHLFTAAALNPPQQLQAGGIVITERHADIGWQMAIVNDQPRRIFQRTWQPNDRRWRNWKIFTDQLLTTRRTDAAIAAALATSEAQIKAEIGNDLNRRLTAEEQARAAAIADTVNEAVNLLQQDLTELESRQVTPARVHGIVDAELADERRARDSAIAAATTAIASTRRAGIDAAVSAAITTERAAERAATDRRVDDRLTPITTRLDDIADDVTAEAAARTADIAAAKRELETAIGAERSGWKQAILREGEARRTGDEAASAALAAETRARGQAITAGDNAVRAAAASDVTARLTQVESRLDARIDGAGFPRGTRMLFQQSSAPTGWTRDASHHDKALRVVSGAVGSGGSKGFSATFGRPRVSGSVSSRVGGRTAAHRLSVAEMPSHSHNVITSTGNNWDQRGSGLGHVTDPRFGAQTSLTGGNQPHSHAAGSLSVSSAFRGGELDLRVRYLDVIVAVKD
jgi:hypothetical protein